MVATDANASRLSVKYTGARFESSASRMWTTLDTTGAKREKQKTNATRNRSQARAERDKYKETSGLQREGAYHTETTTDRRREVKDRTTRGTTTARMFTKGNGTDGGRVEAVRPGLELGSLSPTIGFIQTPFYHERAQYPRNMDSLVRISVPGQHLTLISVERVMTQSFGSSCDPVHADFVQLYLREESQRSLAWTVCGKHAPAAAVYEAHVVLVRFVSNGRYGDRGFKLLFSFHQRSRAPARDREGLWNCLGPEWPSFKGHFLCNLEKECAGREDELNCSYSGHCGEGFLTILGRYRHRYMWMDGTVAFFMRLFRNIDAKCAVFRVTHFHEFAESSMYCDGQISHAHFLCELPSSSTSPHLERRNRERGQNTVHLAPPAQDTWPLPVVTCPDGHVTLTALACDVESVCWLSGDGVVESQIWGVPTKGSCGAPMTSLPAVMTCDNGVQHVPYSLLCDHQQQCDDGSDESFCHFTPCSKDRLLKCGHSSQVVMRRTMPATATTYY